MATINGTNAANNLNGTSLADQIYGLGGNDTSSATTATTCSKAAGCDQLFGSLGFDSASYRSSAAGVQVNLYSAETAGGDAAGDQIFSIEGVRGSASADGLVGDDSAMSCTARAARTAHWPRGQRHSRRRSATISQMAVRATTTQRGWW